MTPELWQQVRDVVAEALELSPQERHAFLDRACSSDHALRREVDLLLSSTEAARTSFLESPAMTRAILETRLRVGERIGPYVVVEFLQAGGMGEVYKAVDTRLHRSVAIKFLPVAFAADPVALDRFQREARAASALNHSRICTIYDVGDHEGRPFFVMEFLEGKSLKDRIAGKALPLSELLDIATQICDALQAAHRKGIVHRDIKPGNVFITTSGQVKVLDFGLAKRTGEEHQAVTATAAGNDENTLTSNEITLTRRGSVIGTAAYLSPEQARGEEVDARTDIYSLGVVLYEMATGRTTFRGETSGELIHAILNDTPAKPSALNPAVPPRLEQIILRSLAKERSVRFQTIQELAGRLHELQQPRIRVSVPIRIAIAVSTVALVVAVIAAAVRFWPFSDQPRGTQTRLTANPDEDAVRTAAISPDGKYLAYSDGTGAYIKQIGTGETHPLVLPKGVGGHPVGWYPDGGHFLLQWFTAADEKPSLWSLSVPGGDARRIADDAWGPAVSPDGSRIAFIRNAVGISGVCRLNLDCRYALGREIWTMAPDGSDPQKILDAPTDDRFGPVAWAPDGRRIAYLRLKGGAASSQFLVEIHDLRTGKSSVVESDPRLNLAGEMLHWQPAVCWTRDGRLVFGLHEVQEDAGSNAWAIRVDSETGEPKGKPIRLTNGQGDISSLSITADGKRLAFIKNSLEPQVYVGELDAAAKVLRNNRRLTLDRRASMPFSWTPDNHSIIFSSNRNGRMEIFEQAIDHTTPELLASDPSADQFLGRVTPDGSGILYVSYPSKPSKLPRIMRVPMAGGPSTALLEMSDLGNVNCARAPASLCFFVREDGAGNNVFYTLDPMRGTSKEILRLPVDQSACSAITPDGSLLAICAFDLHDGHIQLFSMRDGSMRDLVVKGWSGINAVDWTLDSKSLFASSLRPDGTVVLLNVDLEGTAHVILEHKNAGEMCWAIPSSDGKHLASMQMNGESNAWMLENF
jgi:eukaryotic-like serine/threonine-protein kinase